MVSTRLGQVGGHDSTATSADCQQVDDLNIHAKGIKHRWPNLLGLPGRVHHPGGQRHGRLVDLDGIQVVGKREIIRLRGGAHSCQNSGPISTSTVGVCNPECPRMNVDAIEASGPTLQPWHNHDHTNEVSNFYVSSVFRIYSIVTKHRNRNRWWTLFMSLMNLIFPQNSSYSSTALDLRVQLVLTRLKDIGYDRFSRGKNRWTVPQ